jgi:RHS repeat-associated protein
LFANLNSATHAAAGDGNGNIVGLVNMSSGSGSAEYDYNAFGETVKAVGTAASANPFRFSTKYTDADSGLIYYGFRYYCPATGRWLSRDPIKEQGGVNVYGFVGNNPLSRIDPFGLDAFEDKHPDLDDGCDAGKSCSQNFERLTKFLKSALIRLDQDFTDEFLDLAERQVPNPRPRYARRGMTYQDSWNGHVQYVWKTLAACGKCIIILKTQLDSGKCCPPDKSQTRYSVARGIWERAGKRVPGVINVGLAQAFSNDIMNSGGPLNWLIEHGVVGPPLPVPVPVPVP